MHAHRKYRLVASRVGGKGAVDMALGTLIVFITHITKNDYIVQCVILGCS